MQQNVYYASGGNPHLQEDPRPGGPNATPSGGGGGVMGSVMGTFRAWSIASGGNQQGQTASVQAASDPRGFEEMETAHNLRFAQMAQEKDATIEQLEYKLRLREEAIQQLEQNILMQQGATELIRKECEGVQEQLRQLQQQQNNNLGNEDGRRGSGSHAQMEEDEMKEIIQQLHNKLREKSDTNNALLRTTKTQREQILSLEKTVAELRKEVAAAKEAAEEATQSVSNNGGEKGNEAMEEKVEEMKEVIQQLHAKLLDKNNTNAALVRSAKMQNDKCAAFRSEIQALQAAANDTREQHQLDLDRLEQELNARNDEVAALRQQLSAKPMTSITTDARGPATHQHNDIEMTQGMLQEGVSRAGPDGRELLNNTGRSEEDRSIATRSENSRSIGSRGSERNAYGGASASEHERAASPLGEYSSSRYSERSVESDSRHQRGNQYSDDSSQDEFSSYNSEDDDLPANGNGDKGFDDGNSNHRNVPHADKYY